MARAETCQVLQVRNIMDCIYDMAVNDVFDDIAHGIADEEDRWTSSSETVEDKSSDPLSEGTVRDMVEDKIEFGYAGRYKKLDGRGCVTVASKPPMSLLLKGLLYDVPLC